MGILAEKTIIVAGTTGIGGAAARLFGQAGARIVAIGRSAEHGADLANALVAQHTPAIVHCCDLADDGAAEEITALTLERFGRVDALFHVAGISGRKLGDGPLHACTDPGFDTVLRTNVRAMFQLNRACIRHWLETMQPGAILNMASVLGFSFATGHFDAVGYAASKSAIIGMSQHAAATYAKNGIRVNVIAPALVDTPMATRATSDPAMLEFLRRKQPLTRAPLTALDCAQAALFLLSPAAAAVTGIVLPVDGGWCVSG